MLLEVGLRPLCAPARPAGGPEVARPRLHADAARPSSTAAAASLAAAAAARARASPPRGVRALDGARILRPSRAAAAIARGARRAAGPAAIGSNARAPAGAGAVLAVACARSTPPRTAASARTHDAGRAIGAHAATRASKSASARP